MKMPPLRDGARAVRFLMVCRKQPSKCVGERPCDKRGWLHAQPGRSSALLPSAEQATARIIVGKLDQRGRSKRHDKREYACCLQSSRYRKDEVNCHTGRTQLNRQGSVWGTGEQMTSLPSVRTDA